MVADEQTHALPDDAEAVERFANFFGYESRAAFAKDLLGHLKIVQGHYGKLFEGDPAGTAKLPAGQLQRRARTICGCSTIWRRSASRSRSWWPVPCSNGCRAIIARSA